MGNWGRLEYNFYEDEESKALERKIEKLRAIQADIKAEEIRWITEAYNDIGGEG